MEKKGSDSTETLPGNSLYTLKTMLPSNWTDPLSPQIPSTFELSVPPVPPFIYSQSEHISYLKRHCLYMQQHADYLSSFAQNEAKYAQSQARQAEQSLDGSFTAEQEQQL